MTRNVNNIYITLSNTVLLIYIYIWADNVPLITFIICLMLYLLDTLPIIWNVGQIYNMYDGLAWKSNLKRLRTINEPSMSTAFQLYFGYVVVGMSHKSSFDFPIKCAEFRYTRKKLSVLWATVIQQWHLLQDVSKFNKQLTIYLIFLNINIKMNRNFTKFL